MFEAQERGQCGCGRKSRVGGGDELGEVEWGKANRTLDVKTRSTSDMRKSNVLQPSKEFCYERAVTVTVN